MNPNAYIEMDELEGRHWWFNARRSILSSVISNMQLPKKSRILEVGCGTGGNLQMLSKFGDLYSFEMNSHALEIAITKTNFPKHVLAGWCPDNIPFHNQQFDLICIFDVLEHIDNDLQTLLNLKKLLSKDGRMLITVPAYQWLFGPHDTFLHHKRRYLLNELKRKTEAAGFIPVKISYFNTLLFPISAIFRLRDKFFGYSNESSTNVPNTVIGFFLRHIFAMERYLLKYFNLPFGLSLICILKKSDSEI